MSDDFSETLKNKKNLENTINKFEQKTSHLNINVKEIEEKIKLEEDIFDHTTYNYKELSTNILNEYEEVKNLTSHRLFCIIGSYILIVLMYRYFIFDILKIYWFEPFMYIVMLSLSTYIVERIVMTKVNIWVGNKISYLKNGIVSINNDAKNKILEIKNKNIVEKFKDEFNALIQISIQFNDKILKVISSIEHQNMSFRIRDSIVSCCMKYRLVLIDSNIKYQIQEPDYLIRSEIDLTQFYLNKICEQFNMPLNAFKIIYYDYMGDFSQLNIEWNSIKLNDKEILIFLKFLSQNKMIIDISSIEIELLYHLIKSLNKFSLTDLNNSINNYQKFKEVITIFINGCHEEGLIDRYIYDYKLMYDNSFNYYKENYDNKFYYEQIKKYLINIIKPLNIYSINSIIKVVIGVISSLSYPWLLEISCIELSQDENSMDLLFVYQRLKEEKNININLIEAINSSNDYVNKQKEAYKILRDEMFIDLRSGKWVQSSEKTLRKKMDEIKDMLIDIKEDKMKIASIKKVFESYVSENTIMHVIDSKTLVAYVINAKPEYGEGGIFKSIDELQSHKHGFWFTTFTPYSRIGILPPDKDFSTFCIEFENKLIKISEDSIANIIIQRFSTSEYNLKQISIGEDYEPPWKIIKKLAVEHMTEAQLRMVLQYGELIHESYLSRSFAEIIYDFIHNSFRGVEDELITSFTKIDIIKILLNKYKCKNLKEFCSYVNKNKNKDELKKELINMFRYTYPNINKKIMNDIVNEFINILLHFYRVSLTIGFPMK